MREERDDDEDSRIDDRCYGLTAEDDQSQNSYDAPSTARRDGIGTPECEGFEFTSATHGLAARARAIGASVGAFGRTECRESERRSFRSSQGGREPRSND